MPSVLVTGAAGFIGAHLTLSSVRSGQHVLALARSLPADRVAGVEWIEADLERAPIEPLVAGCDAIVHLACCSMSRCANDPALAERSNAVTTVRLLEAARRLGVSQFVFTSTGQVYGGHGLLPNVEDAPAAPEGPYAIAKLSAEQWCRLYAAQYGISIQVLRLFNVYGRRLDGQARGTVEEIFVDRVAAGLPPTILGSGETGRDFIHVDDVVRAIDLALSRTGDGSPVNVGTGRLTTLTDLAGMITRQLSADVSPIYLPSAGSSARYQADTRRASERLGFVATVSLEDGLRRLIADREPVAVQDVPLHGDHSAPSTRA